MLDFNKIRTYSIRDRKSKKKVSSFPDITTEPPKFDSPSLDLLVDAVVGAHKKRDMVILQCGGHVVKTGMSPYIIDLVKRGIITHLATNGSTSIHDFEIAMIGETSEDVGKSIEDGSFGMAEETGRFMNEAINASQEGYGLAIGRKIDSMDLPFKDRSLFYAAFKKGIPATVHVAIGTDIIHQHPSCDGAKIGAATYYDFKKYVESVAKLNGGVLINVGSAVILPEVFLKALSIARNLGYDVRNITTANLDMINHYRPKMNVIKRPTSLGKQGLTVIGRHEETIPNLYHKVMKRLGGVR
jgi:deoxyhypusine synthase